jgi:hypothetical protein
MEKVARHPLPRERQWALPTTPARFIGGYNPNVGHKGAKKFVALSEASGITDTDLHRLTLADRKVDGLQMATADTDFVRGEGDHTAGFVVGEFGAEHERIGQCEPLAVRLQPKANRGDILCFETTRVAGPERFSVGELGLESVHRRMRMPSRGASAWR